VFIWSDVTDTTAGDFLYLAGVQLEAGAVATPFERRPFGTELQLCQRYYWQTSTSTQQFQAFGAQRSTTGAEFFIQNPVPMRVAPTIAVNSAGTFSMFSWSAGVARTATAWSAVFAKTLSFVIQIDWSSAVGASSEAVPLDIATTDPLRVSAEL
jgi:hypothetical protein